MENNYEYEYANSVYYYNRSFSKFTTDFKYWAYRIIAVLLFLSGIISPVIMISLGYKVTNAYPYIPCFIGILMIMSFAMLDAPDKHRFDAIISLYGDIWILDKEDNLFLTRFNLQAYKLIYPKRSYFAIIAAAYKNRKNEKAINRFLVNENGYEIIVKNPEIAARKIDKVTYMRKASFYFLVKYKTENSSIEHIARFYNDIKDYNRLYDRFKVKLMQDTNFMPEVKKPWPLISMIAGGIAIVMSMTIFPKYENAYLNLISFFGGLTALGFGLSEMGKS